MSSIVSMLEEDYGGPYGGSLSDEPDTAHVGGAHDPTGARWGDVQEINFLDTTVDEAGNPLISLEPSTPAQLAWFNNAVAECVQRTHAENASLT